MDFQGSIPANITAQRDSAGNAQVTVGSETITLSASTALALGQYLVNGTEPSTTGA